MGITIKRIVCILLLIFLVLSTGCAPQITKSPQELLLEQTTAFSLEQPATDLLQALSRERVNVLGEMHYIKEFGEFYGALMPGLHAQGVRVVLIEHSLFVGGMLDLYVTNQIESLPSSDDDKGMDFYNYSELIEAIKQLNQTLRDQGQSDEQMRLYAFDLPLDPVTDYSGLIRVLRRDLGLSGRFFQHPKDNLAYLESSEDHGLSDEQAEEFHWLTQQAVYLKDHDDVLHSIRFSQQALTQEQAEFREAFIHQNILHYLEEQPDAKCLVISGSTHAQRERHRGALATSDEVETLVERLIADGIGVNSFDLQFQTIQLADKASWGIPTHMSASFATDDGDLFMAFQEEFPDQPLWINLLPLKDSQLRVSMPITLDQLLDGADLEIARVFDGIIFIPEVESLIDWAEIFHRSTEQ